MTLHELTGAEATTAQLALTSKYKFDTPLVKLLGSTNRENRFSLALRDISMQYYGQAEQGDSADQLYPIELPSRKWRSVAKALKFYAYSDPIGNASFDLRPQDDKDTAQDLLTKLYFKPDQPATPLPETGQQAY